jgi:nucleotide-binding universal stress UspA family protein
MNAPRQRFQRILVAVDFDATAESALSHGYAWARHFGAALTVLHVSARDSTDRAETQQATGELKALTETDSGGVPQPALLVKRGPAARAIADAAAAMGADLVVMGSHGRGAVGRWVLGTVAAAVLQHTDRPVLLVKAPGDFMTRGTVVAAVDLSEASEAVVRHAAQLAAECGASLYLLHALPIGDHQSPGHQVMQRAATHQLRRLQEQYAPPPVKTSLQVAMRGGAPGTMIARYAEDQRASLLVVGGHGTSGWTRGLLGNVTQRVIHETSLPVLVVRQNEPKRA